MNKTYEQAQSAIAAASSDPVALTQARHQAETVLVVFLRALGWEVIVLWQD